MSAVGHMEICRVQSTRLEDIAILLGVLADQATRALGVQES